MAGDRPQSGDLVVHGSGSPGVYLITREDERPQFYCTAMDQAIRLAVDIAAYLKVDVWEGETPLTIYRRVAQYRVGDGR